MGYAVNNSARCPLARYGAAFIYCERRWSCACGARGIANSPESAQESINSHKERGHKEWQTRTVGYGRR